MEEIKTRKCSKCKRELPATINNFHKSAGGKYDLYSICKNCKNKNRRKYVKENRKREIEYKSRKRKEEKLLVISHYGGRCAVCGEATLAFLTIDHIDGGGRKHKREIGGCQNFYPSIIKEGFPPGYQVLCWNHNWLKHLEFIRLNLSNKRKTVNQRKYDLNLKTKIIKHYGDKCSCCGESNINLLTIDHINNDGIKHGDKRRHLHLWIIRNNFPLDLQVLCFNCNCGRQLNNGTCPHKHHKD